MTTVIEMIGLGRSGKSTQIKLLETYLKNKGYSVGVIHDRKRAEDLIIPFTEIIGYKLAFASRALDQYFKYKDKVNYIIIERGWVDFKVWIKAEEILKHITEERANQLKTTFYEYDKEVDEVVCLVVDLAVAKERQELFLENQGDKFNDFVVGNYATALEGAYSQFEDCVKVDGSDSEEEIHSKIIEIVEKV
jgi:thymidylate kinase